MGYYPSLNPNPPTISSWDTPSKWDLDPQNPDYWVISGSWRILTLSLEIDRYRMWYVAFGFTYDVASSFFNIPTISIRPGNVHGYGGIYQEFPDQVNLEKYLTGVSFNGGGGILGGGSMTWVPGAGEYITHTSTEWGAYIPGSLGISGTYAFSSRQVVDFFNTLLELFR